PGGPGHRVAQHLGSRKRDHVRPPGGSAGAVRRAAQRHLRLVPAAQAPAAARAAVDRFPQASLQPIGFLEKQPMTLEALLAYAHFLAILTLVVFIASEAALPRRVAQRESGRA